jgi:hypothetical protein
VLWLSPQATDHEASKAAQVAAEDAYDRVADAQEAVLAGTCLLDDMLLSDSTVLLPNHASAPTDSTGEQNQSCWCLQGRRLTRCIYRCRRYKDSSDRVGSAVAPLLHLRDGCLCSGVGRRLCRQCHHPPWPARCFGLRLLGVILSVTWS